MAREQVVARLERAQSLLPEGFSFVVLDAWRSHAVQQRVRDHYQATVPDLAEGFVADPQSPTTRPPHVVGGALDLTLAWHGRPMALGTPYDDFTSDAHVNAWEDPQRSSPTDRAIRLLRRLLASVLIEAGFAPYPQEWWHWSYGDDIWALRNGQPARYDVFVEEVDAPRSPGAGALDAGTPGPRA
jgi:D-alanyl-D-alanine dipeptidase